MARISILFGLLLIALGVGSFVYALPHFEKPPYTALIPAGFGLLLLVLGVLALNEHRRKHAMHLAAMVGLIGVIGGAVMLLLPLIRGTGIKDSFAYGCQASLTLLCLIFVGLCVNSFIQARRRRTAAPQPPIR